MSVEECQKCNLLSHQSDLRDFVDYEAGSMHNWAAGYGGILDVPKEDRLRRVVAILEILKNLKEIKVLDFGSGEGEMMQAMSLHFEVDGLEPEEGARNKCLERGMKVYAATKEIESNQFDLITMFHVIEHLYNPASELQKILLLLKPGGILLI